MSKKQLPSVAGRLSQAKADGKNLTRLLAPARSGANAVSSSNKLAKPGASNEEKPVSLSATGTVRGGLNFGKAPKSATSTSATSNSWNKLLKSTLSGGASGVLGGGVLQALGGLGGIVSGIAGLFGGSKKALQPLTAFQLPSSKNVTSGIGRKAGSAQSVAAFNGATKAAAANPVYSNVQNSLKTTGISGTGSSQYQNQQIVQAVKQALLTSSSLNDVIAEI